MFENQNQPPVSNQQPMPAKEDKPTLSEHINQLGQKTPVSKLPPDPKSDQLSTSANQPAVDDMFAQTDKDAGPAPELPTQPGQAPPPVTPQAPADMFGGRSIWQNKFFVTAVIVVGIIAIGLVAWGAISIMSKSSNQLPNINSNSDLNLNSNAAVNLNQNVNANIDTNLNSNLNTGLNANLNTNTDLNANLTPKPVVKPPQDSDNDGLTDLEEKRLGTDPFKADTDHDGLKDRTEVMVYHTDPLNADSDGDGYKDGEEVINGFDPTKPGSARLYDVPK